MGFFSSSLAFLVFMATVPCQEGFGVTPECPKGFEYYNSYCYGFFIKPVPWHEAELKCQSYGKYSHLVSIHNKEEQAHVAAIIDSYKYHSTVWTGLYSVGKMKYKEPWWWADDSPYDYSAWAPGQPNFSPGLYYFCAQLFPTKGKWKWDDTDCEISNAFICKTLP